jgi:hypothetical protein
MLAQLKTICKDVLWQNRRGTGEIAQQFGSVRLDIKAELILSP